MFYGAQPIIFELAKQLRDRQTEAEIYLWDHLKFLNIPNIRIKRQHPVLYFIADFYCHEARLVVEIDGEIHEQQKEYDDGRSAEMERYHIKVIRFTNSEIVNNMEEVIKVIHNETSSRISSPPWGI